MKVLVTFAVPAEFSAWRRKRQFEEIARSPFHLYSGQVGGTSVRVLLTGIGSQIAAEAVRWALSGPTDICISSGFAGALNAGIALSETLAARLVCQAGRELAVASDAYLFKAACQSGARPVDRFMTSPRLLTTSDEKFSVSDEADAVEMESYSVLAEAARRGVRAVSVRAVSDVAESSLPFNFDLMRNDEGQISVTSLITHLLRNPGKLPSLLQLAKDCRLASRCLAEFLEDYILLLAVNMDHSSPEMVGAI
jgi:nucleoside phosphorylase